MRPIPRERETGKVGVAIYEFGSIQISDTLISDHVSTLSRQKEVTKMCPKYLFGPFISLDRLRTKYRYIDQAKTNDVHVLTLVTN